MGCRVPFEAKPFDRQEVASICLHCEHRAGFYSLAIQFHGAGSADGGFTADVRAFQTRDIAQVVNQQQARFDIGRVRLAVNGETDGFVIQGYQRSSKKLSEMRGKAKRGGRRQTVEEVRR